MDQLHRPRSFPEAKTQYTLKDMSVVWHLYGGRDFAAAAAATDRPDPRARRNSSLRYWGVRNGVGGYGCSLKTGGGRHRDHSVLVEVELSKVRGGVRD
jgi:autophagy-related protein 2